MTRLILHGCNGKMGRIISEVCREDSDVTVVAGIDLEDLGTEEFPVFTDIFKCDIPADVMIDFSNAKAADSVLDYCLMRQMPLVFCTTGLDDGQAEKLMQASEKIAILKSANMSLGVNTLFDLLKKAVKVLAPAGYDLEIVEKHHRQKLAMGGVYEYTFDRSRKRARRQEKEIGISAVRGGTIVGEHEVIFAGKDEVITIQHTAYSRAVFGKGAVEAAKFLKGKPAGHYDMRGLVQSV